jgi:hypothetical protein
MMDEIIRNQVNLQRQMRNINVERPVAALTLRINADFSLPLAGAAVTWSNEIRNLLFTWSGTDITIPSDGIYHICSYWRTNTAIATLEAGFDVVRSGITYVGVGRLELTPASLTNFTYSFTQYFLKDDIVRFRLVPSVATTLLYRTEITGANGQSGILHISQMTSAI